MTVSGLVRTSSAMQYDYDAPVFDLFFTPDDGEKISVKDVMELQRSQRGH